MNIITLLQFSDTVAAKSAEMAVKDPHGAIITIVSVLMVFLALIILFFAYTFIGKISSGQWKLQLKEKKAKSAAKGQPSPEEAAAIAIAIDHELNGEVYAAIGTALHQYLGNTVHDMESYIITIRRK